MLRVLASRPTEWRYGYDLAQEVALKSGALYPILMRLSDRDLLESQWEASVAGRPPRHLYRLTARGAAEVANLIVEPQRVPSAVLRRQPGAV